MDVKRNIFDTYFYITNPAKTRLFSLKWDSEFCIIQQEGVISFDLVYYSCF